MAGVYTVMKTETRNNSEPLPSRLVEPMNPFLRTFVVRLSGRGFHGRCPRDRAWGSVGGSTARGIPGGNPLPPQCLVQAQSKRHGTGENGRSPTREFPYRLVLPQRLLQCGSYNPLPSRLLLNRIHFPVTMARGFHLFPSRTQQLSLFAPMVLGG